MILAGCMMLDHIGQSGAAAHTREALEAALRSRQALTPDLGGSSGTDAFARSVIEHLR
jgi:isocitrate dehydrogenase (NAD+)